MSEIKTGVLLSGGIDSIALTYWKRPKYAFTIDYGQLAAKAEIHSATQVASTLNIDHHVLTVDCSLLGSGNMSNFDSLEVSPVEEWWPFRNQLLVTLACMKGISLGLESLLVASVATDGQHKDGTKLFYERLDKVVGMQEGNISIRAPAIDMTSMELLKKSKVPLSILLWAHSCHTSCQPCMKCGGCEKYLYTMQQLGVDS